MGYLVFEYFCFFYFFCFFCGGFGFFFLVYGVFVFSFMEWYFLILKFNFCENSFFFSVVLFLVALSVILFSSFYMDGELNLVYFLLVFMIFVLSMFVLSWSFSLFFIVLGWDVLGVSSFFLVFFYNNWDSCSGAMNTVLTNRIGDFFLFIFFVYFFFSGFSVFLLVYLFLVVGFFLLLAGFSKSAQFPFSGWLPKAMSAPTPVSALVHSSTLVTAGLILIMGFFDVVLSFGLVVVLFYGGLFTMFFSSVCAVFECDLKKIVALSTLSQMGFSMMTLGMGYYFVSLLHLVGHALFKSCLFMQVGFYIHSCFGQQDVRGCGGLGSSFFFVHLQMVVTLFCLCGLFFTSGFVTKDMILFFFFGSSWVWFLMFFFFVGVFFTYVYSYRMFLSLFSMGGLELKVGVGSWLVGIFSFLLVVFSIFGLWWLVNNLVLLPVVYLYLDMYIPFLYLLFFFFFICFVFIFVFSELKSSFLVDYVAKQFGFLVMRFKFFDVMVNYFVVSFLGVFEFFSLMGVLFLKSFNLSLLVIVFFVLIFLL